MNNNKELKQFEWIVKTIIILPLVLAFVWMIYTHFSPPETIVDNGHTYHLADENDVDEEIEKFGHRYILADESIESEKT